MVVSVSEKSITNTTQSLYHFLNYEVYARSGSASYTTNTLKDFFSGLNIIVGDPDNLEQLKLPTISLKFGDLDGGQTEGYGSHIEMETLSYTLHGYVGGQENHGHSLAYRDLLYNDLNSLIRGQDYINLYEDSNYITGAYLGDIGINNDTITSSVIAIDDETDAGRYQFSINFEVEYLKRL